MHKRQNESREEATCLQNSLKAMQGSMDFLPQRKDRWHQDSASRLLQAPTIGGRKGAIRYLGTAQVCCSQAPGGPSWSQAESPASQDQLTLRCPGRRLRLAAMYQRVNQAPYWVSRGLPPSADPFCRSSDARLKLDINCHNPEAAPGEQAPGLWGII